MKTTISKKPNNHKIEFPCLMNLKGNVEAVFVVRKTNSYNGYWVAGLCPGVISNPYVVSSECLFREWELFVGEITLSND